ncbi:MAG: phosphoglycerate kinase [Candidatus Electrothrix sp. AS4_5]|nr:phosphoglycerate kinase [Candidatus Electrothrix gigas]
MKTIRDLDINGKRVLIRVDFNVPLNEQDEITDDLRIRTVLPTIQYALDQGAKVILASHRGRPKGQRVEKYSLAPVVERLAEFIGKEVLLAPDCIGSEVRKMVDLWMVGTGCLLLENLRFHPGEEANDPAFSKQLALLADVYINDAFAVSHRAHASVAGVTEHVKEKAAGLLLDKEMSFFHRSVDEPQRPLVAIVGGAKVSGKLEALTNMLNKVNCLLIGGAMANTFLKSQGYSVGASKVEDDLLDNARQLLVDAKKKGVKVYLPVDVIAADRFAADAVCKQVTIQDIPENWMALDIGPASVVCFSEVLADAKTIIWNGPMGAFEMDAYARGTMALPLRHSAK